VLAAPQPRRFDSIFGTSAERLLRATRRPILVVHRETQGNYRRVAMAVDLANASLPLIQTAARLGALNDAETTLLHAAHGWHGAALLRLQAMLTAAEMDVERTRIEVRTGPAAVVIQNALEAERPELLAIGASRWLLIRRLLARSVANSVLSKPICDVLVIPQRVYLRPATDATGAGATEPSTIPPHRAA
jgi:nucleotide-binding universal stress UspA family protein